MLSSRKVLIIIISIFILLNFSIIFDFIPLTAKTNSYNLKSFVPSKDEILVVTLPLSEPGDCTLVKYGDSEVIIDMGGVIGDSKLITEALNTYVTDGCLEYIIITHGDHDHLCNFGEPSLENNKSALENWLGEDNYVETLIDFDPFSDDTITKDNYINLDSLYKGITTENHDTINIKNINKPTAYMLYVSMRDRLIRNNRILNHYTASQCTYKIREANGFITKDKSSNNDKAKNKFTNIFNLYFDKKSKNEHAELNILYNYYYDHSYNDDPVATSRDRNLLSVSSLIKFNGQKFLFTGDLEEYDSQKYFDRVMGETLLVKYNPEISNVLYYKAAHHGSATSNSTQFIDYIKPQYCVMTAVAGGNYNFPRDDAIQAVSKYTDYIYIPKVNTDKGVVDYYGAIYAKYSKKTGKMDVTYQNKKMPKSIFFTDWFLKNRSAVFNIYNLCADFKGTKPSQTDCTYIKFGHYDILINAGVENRNSAFYTDQIIKLCNDHVLDLVIISDVSQGSYSDLIVNNGLLSKIGIKNINSDDYISNIGKFVYHSYDWWKPEDNNKNWNKLLSRLTSLSKKGLVDEMIGTKDFQRINNEIIIDSNLNNYCKIKFLDYKYNNEKGFEEKDNSIPLTFDLKLGNQKFKYLHLGNINKTDNFLDVLARNDKYLHNSVSVFQVPNHGKINETTTENPLGFEILRKACAADTGCDMLLNNVYNEKNSSDIDLYPTVLYKHKYQQFTYITQWLNNNKLERFNGDISVELVFGLQYKKQPIRQSVYKCNFSNCSLSFFGKPKEFVNLRNKVKILAYFSQQAVPLKQWSYENK